MLKLLFTTILIFTFTASDCQIDVKKMLKKKSEEKAEVDKTIDKGFDKIDALFKKDKKDKEKDQKSIDQNNKSQTGESIHLDEESVTLRDSRDSSPTLTWSKYDFVPGEE